ncbi:unnamed protein product, partial [Mesorhabditis belari]|uniref:Arsenite methyltransferase n=1 Tax=Mesorhabditis belari TaxID=2138241 RepID=A0AAF3FH87_9BILA
MDDDEKRQRRSQPKRTREAMKKLKEIAEDLKQKLPFEAVMPTERITYPTKGYDSDCNATNTVHIDNFLFTDDDVDKLVEEGKLSRNFCQQCGSKDTKPLNFISHSLSPEQIEFMFTKLVPLQRRNGLVVLDIGSRMGAVLYGAALIGAENVTAIGIELNEEFVQLQKTICQQYGISNIKLYCDNVRNQGDIVSTADIVVMNNVFSFFMSESEQVSCWEFLKDKLKPGCIILHNPSLVDVTEHLPLKFTIEDWLDEKPVEDLAFEFCGTNEGSEYEDCTQMHITPPNMPKKGLDDSGVKLSPVVLDMKFMSRTKKKLEMEEQKKKERDEKRRLLGNDPQMSSSSVEVKPDPDAEPQLIFERCYEKLEDLCFGRMSFKGFNPEVEKLMVYYENIRRGIEPGESEEEDAADVNKAEMANTIGGSLRKKFTKKRDRTDEVNSLRDESTGDKTAPKRKSDEAQGSGDGDGQQPWKRSRKTF